MKGCDVERKVAERKMNVWTLELHKISGLELKWFKWAMPGQADK